MRGHGALLLAAAGFSLWCGTDACFNQTPPTLLPCPGDGSDSCFCHSGGLCWTCDPDSVCGSDDHQCVSRYYFTVVAIAAVIVACCCCFCFSGFLLVFYRRRHKAQRQFIQQSPLEGIPIQVTDQFPQDGVPVNMCHDAHPPTPGTDGGRTPPCEGLATVRGPSGTGWDCGPLVRSASQNSFGSVTPGIPHPESPAAPVYLQPVFSIDKRPP